MPIRYLMFDFFGTLAQYRDGVVGNPVGRSLSFLKAQGIVVDADGFAARWQSVWDDLDREASASLREVHMHDGARCLLRELGHTADDETVAAFVAHYIDDWNEGVVPVPGAAALLDAIGLGASVVSNTYYPPLVPLHLERMGLARRFDRVVTSIDHGWRKPHGSIYRAALDGAGVRADEVLFVGDNELCDYHGPRRLGMQAVLVSERPHDGVPEMHRIARLHDLERWLERALTGSRLD